MPKTRVDFWKRKFIMTEERDRKVIQMLLDKGWRVFVVWECELRDLGAL